MRRLWTMITFLVFLSLALAGCGALTAGQPEAAPTASGPRLRITNNGEHYIKNLTVLFPDQEITFGDVAAGATTEYQPAPDGVYNYGAYRYEVDGETVTQPVIDWVGETPKQGSFTYVIEYSPDMPLMQRITLVDVVTTD